MPNGYAPNGYLRMDIHQPYPRQPYYQNGQQPMQYGNASYPNYPNAPPKRAIPKCTLSKRALPKRALSKCTGRYPSQEDDDYVSDRLSEDMSFRKLMQTSRSRNRGAPGAPLQREYPATKQPAKKRHVRLLQGNRSDGEIWTRTTVRMGIIDKAA